MQCLGAISKTTERSWFISKVNRSTSQQSKSVPQPLMLRKLKSIDFSKTYKTFQNYELKKKKNEEIFSSWGQECKSKKSRDTQDKRQVWPCSTKRSRQKLTDFSSENTLVIVNIFFQQLMSLYMDITRWSILKSD